MRAAGIDTAELLRALLIAFLEGAMIYGVFHGDLHGGNLFVMPDGRVALFDYGMTGRMDEQQRLAFLRMMMTGAVNDMRGQLEAFRDLGALPPDADIDALDARAQARPAGAGPDQDDRRGAGARDPGRPEGAARAGRASCRST